MRPALRSLVPGRLATSWPGALLALLAWGFVAPSSARAGCSHYVVARTDALGLSAQLDLLGSPGVASMGGDPAAPTRPDRPFPCSGAFCSGTPAYPPAPAYPVTPQGGQWAIHEPPAPIEGPGSAAAPSDRRILHRLVIPPTIFHPPRPAAPLPIA